MRLAIIRQQYRPDGGAERFVSRALQVLAGAGLNVSVITRQWQGARDEAYRVIECDPPKRNRISREKEFADQALAIVRQEGFDLVQSHERIPGCSIYRAGDGVHKVWLAHRSRVMSPLARWWQGRSAYHRYVLDTEKAMFEHPDLRAVICNSQMVRNEILQHFQIEADNIRVIYNGVDTVRFHPGLKQYREEIRQDLGIADSTPLLIFVGSGFERKGLKQAIEGLARSSTDAQLMVVGRDKRQSRYEKLAKRLSVAERVHFLGVQEDVRPYYGAADALYLPTLYDPFPNVAMEAMACGLAILTSQQCGAAEKVESGVNGFVFDALDIDAQAQAIDRLKSLTPQPYEQEGPSVQQQLVSLYQELLEGTA